VYVHNEQGDQIGRIFRLLGDSLLWPDFFENFRSGANFKFFFQGYVQISTKNEMD
jgi:hypothetical protein